MNTVQYLNNFVDRPLVKKLFLRFSNKYGNLWTSWLGPNGDWQSCEDDWLEELSYFTVKNAVAAFRKALATYKDYPPTQGQLIELCLRESGIPPQDEIINLMIRREFTHPMVKLVYDKIGSWELTNAKTEVIKAKTKTVYAECLINFRDNPDEQWKALNSHNEQKRLEAPELSKIPSNAERISFSERMAQYQRMADEQLLKLKDHKHPEFNENEIKKTHRDFKPEVFEAYKKYLLETSDELALSLPLTMSYNRIRFIAEKERPWLLKQAGYNPATQGQYSDQPRGKNWPSRVYKNWAD